MERLASRRLEAERRLEDLRQALEREVGWAPGRVWVAPVVAFACGLMMARSLGGRRRRRAAGKGV